MGEYGYTSSMAKWEKKCIQNFNPKIKIRKNLENLASTGRKYL